MKHQYFGDISDYKKYGVLRAVTNNGKLKLLVCWMLTPSDLRTDGNNNDYLQKANEWRHHEPDIFDFLYDSVVVKKTKDLGLVEKHNIVPGTAYFNEILLDNLSNRETYFQKLEYVAKDYDLIFFDPDNGIATSSMIKGGKSSSKYIFWDEIEKFWTRGHSLLIYQHFPRVNRMEYISRKVGEINDRLSNNETYTIRTTHMVYFLIPQEGHSLHFKRLKEKIEGKWSEGRISVERFVCERT